MSLARTTALAALTLLILTACLVLLTSAASFRTQDREHIDARSMPAHWTGTDDLGRDRSVRMALALVLVLGGAAVASLIATLISMSIGVGAAFAPAFLGKSLMFGSDLFLTLPWLFLLMIVRSALPLNVSPIASAALTFLLLAVLGWPAFARVNYARSLSMRAASWMLHARASGLRPMQLALSHLFPHLRPLLLAQFLVYLPICVTAEANLGTLGLGISEPLPSWGSMLLALRKTSLFSTSPWIYLPLALLVLVLLLLETSVFEEEPA